MGFQVEQNTMLRLIDTDPQPDTLEINKRYITKRSNNRSYVIEIPILLLAEDFSVLGYCLVHSAKNSKEGTEIEFSVMNLFEADKSMIYTEDLKTALKEAGYL